MNLPESIERILKSYAMAAGAAGVGALALVPASEAKVIDKAVQENLSRNEPFYLGLHPFNHSIRDYTLEIFTYSHYPVSVLNVRSYGENNSNQVWGTDGGRAIALHRGMPVGPKGHFSHLGAHALAGWGYTSTGFSSGGLWSNVKDRYLGLKFFVEGKAHYGWARLTVSIRRPCPFLDPPACAATEALHSPATRTRQFPTSPSPPATPDQTRMQAWSGLLATILPSLLRTARL